MRIEDAVGCAANSMSYSYKIDFCIACNLQIYVIYCCDFSIWINQQAYYYYSISNTVNKNV